MKTKAVVISLLLTFIPVSSFAQLDAIIDAVVDAVEPTPVYDTGLTNATEDLARKIDRLNQVLFGGAEETSAAYRYKALYSDLLDVTTSLADAIGSSYNDYERLRRMYDGLQGAGYYDYVVDAQTSYYIYQRNVSRYKRLVENFTKVFRKTSNTNAEVKQAARVAVDSLRADQKRQRDSIDMVINTTMAAIELAKGAEAISFSTTEYIKQSEKDFGTEVEARKGGGGSLGSVGIFVMVIIGLMSTVYAAFIGFRIMNGYPETEKLIARLIIVIAVALITILALQSHI